MWMAGSFNMIVAMMTALWAVSVAASLLAMGWSVTRSPRGGWQAVVAAGAGLAIGYLGWAHFFIRYSRTVNGSGWTLDSRWFFLAAMILACLSLGVVAVCTLRRSRVRSHS
jgi:hypothetical protein